MSHLKKILVNKNICKSIWFMRQAGRYLPEFRAIRSKNPNFINLCLNSQLSSEITLQPINRFDLDSAIIFSDILLVPYALGQKVEFVKDLGPKIDDFDFNKLMNNNEKDFTRKLDPVYKAIEITRKKLNKKKSLISFIGAPWTLIVYMLNLRKKKNHLYLKKLDSENFEIDRILNELIKYLCIHIKNQIDAGADVVQIFDSWAGLIPNKKIKKLCFVPNGKITDYCKKKKISVICFPKGLKEKYKDFNNFVKPDGLNLDADINPKWAKRNLTNVVLQGGLDPKILLQKEDKIFEEATKYIKTFSDIPYIFNLGHGLLPETDPDRVEKLIKFYRNFNA